MSAPRISTDTKVRTTMKRTGMSLDELVEAIDDGEADDLGIDKSVAAAIRRRAAASKESLTTTSKRTQDTDQAVTTMKDDDDNGARTVANTTTELSSAQQQQAAQQTAALQQAQQQQAQQTAALQQAQQQAAQQQAAQQTAALQQAAQQQAQQQQAWAAAQQLQQAQQQATKSTATTISQAELNQLMKDLLGTRSSDTDTGDTSTERDGDNTSTKRLETSELSGLSPQDVSFDKVSGGKMSKEEAAQAVLDACDLNGVPDDPQVRQKWINLMVPMGLNESGLDPNAGNGWDSNAHGETQKDGLPFNSSRGAWQTIPTTFASYHVAGTSTSIYDPVASAAAAQRYMFDRYSMTPEGDNMDSFASARGISLASGDSSGTYKGY